MLSFCFTAELPPESFANPYSVQLPAIHRDFHGKSRCPFTIQLVPSLQWLIINPAFYKQWLESSLLMRVFFLCWQIPCTEGYRFPSTEETCLEGEACLCQGVSTASKDIFSPWKSRSLPRCSFFEIFTLKHTTSIPPLTYFMPFQVSLILHFPADIPQHKALATACPHRHLQLGVEVGLGMWVSMNFGLRDSS